MSATKEFVKRELKAGKKAKDLLRKLDQERDSDWLKSRTRAWIARKAG